VRILEAAGYEVIVAQRDFANRNFIERMHDTLSSGARVVALLSPDYLSSDYCLAEWSSAIAGDPLNRKGRLIVLRVGDCEPHGLLGGLAYHDLVPFRNDQQRFAQAVLGAVDGGADHLVASGVAAATHAPRRSFTGALYALAALAAIFLVGGLMLAISHARFPTPATIAASDDETQAQLQTVLQYYADWNDRRLPQMWDLLSPRFHHDTERKIWDRGHSADEAIHVSKARPAGKDTVAATIVSRARTTNGEMHESTAYITWHLIQQNGRWLLDTWETTPR
jgi:hypothetical protein